MFERFTNDARLIVADAQRNSNELGHTHTGTEHILLAVLQNPNSLATTILNTLGVGLDVVEKSLKDHFNGVTTQASSLQQSPFTPRAKQAIEMALRESLRMGINYVGAEHILLGMLRDPESVGSKVMASLGVTYETVLDEYQHPPKEITTGNGGVRILVRRDTVTITINANAIVSVDGDAVKGEEYILEADDEHVVTIKVAE